MSGPGSARVNLGWGDHVDALTRAMLVYPGHGALWTEPDGRLLHISSEYPQKAFTVGIAQRGVSSLVLGEARVVASIDAALDWARAHGFTAQREGEWQPSPVSFLLPMPVASLRVS